MTKKGIFKNHVNNNAPESSIFQKIPYITRIAFYITCNLIITRPKDDLEV